MKLLRNMIHKNLVHEYNIKHNKGNGFRTTLFTSTNVCQEVYLVHLRNLRFLNKLKLFFFRMKMKLMLVWELR